MIVDWIIGKELDKTLGVRFDGTPVFPYPNPTYFGCKEEPFSFLSGNNLLVGGRYSYGDGPYRGVLVFFHGAGAGAFAYSKEISSFAKQGYLVYAYDGTGCMRSPGKNIISMTQCLVDQKAFFSFLDKDEKAMGLTRYAVGHSWGGFAALGCLQEEYHIEKVICIAGFASIASMMEEKVPKMEKYDKALKRVLRKKYGFYGDFDALPLMKSTQKPILYVQGDGDKMVDYSKNLRRYEQELKGHKNVRFLTVKGRAHNPYWTKATEAYFRELVGQKRIDDIHREQAIELDDQRLYEEDEWVMKTMFDFLAA